MKLLIWPTLAVLVLWNEPTAQVYKGGRWGFTGVTLTLLADSTFTYLSWTDSGRDIKDKGTWRKNGNTLVLQSRSKRNGLFHHDSFVMKGDTLKLYSKQDSAHSYDFYRRHYTLILQRPLK